jgi:hypothetical protein
MPSIVSHKGVVIGGGRRGYRMAGAVATCHYMERRNFMVGNVLILRLVSDERKKNRGGRLKYARNDGGF